MPLYNKLKEYRALIGVNQTRMGELVGVSRQTISQIERGDYSPSVTLALKIAKICNAKVEDIFSYEEDEENDDSYIGDCNISGHFGIKAANTTYPGIAFFNNANAHLGNLTAYSNNIK